MTGTAEMEERPQIRILQVDDDAAEVIRVPTAQPPSRETPINEEGPSGEREEQPAPPEPQSPPPPEPERRKKNTSACPSIPQRARSVPTWPWSKNPKTKSICPRGKKPDPAG